MVYLQKGHIFHVGILYNGDYNPYCIDHLLRYTHQSDSLNRPMLLHPLLFLSGIGNWQQEREIQTPQMSHGPKETRILSIESWFLK